MLTEVPAETFKAPLTDSTTSHPVDGSVSSEKPKSPEVEVPQHLPKDTEVKLLFQDASFFENNCNKSQAIVGSKQFCVWKIHIYITR